MVEMVCADHSAVCVLGISFVSIQPVGAGGSIPHLDKVLHALAYAILTGFALFALPRQTLLVIFLVISTYGAGLEVVQGLFTIGRTASVFDAMANAIGTLIMLALWVFIWRVKRKTVLN
jgi:VanZ family protein